MPTSPFEIIQLVVRIALALAFIGMGIMHFRPGPRRVMAKLIPPGMRWQGVANPANLVAFTGVCEIAGGVGLLFPPTQLITGICLVVFLVAVFPANVYAARNPDRFGSLAIPLVPRLLGQLVLIGLVIFSVV